jgi:hypothetical protein
LLDSVDLSKLQKVLVKLKKDPEVAYVLASLKKGLAGADLSSENKAQLVAEIRAALEASPTILRAIAEYRG